MYIQLAVDLIQQLCEYSFVEVTFYGVAIHRDETVMWTLVFDFSVEDYLCVRYFNSQQLIWPRFPC